MKIAVEGNNKKDSGDSIILCNMDQVIFPEEDADDVSTPLSEKTQ
jgi:hypothetical protein